MKPEDLSFHSEDYTYDCHWHTPTATRANTTDTSFNAVSDGPAFPKRAMSMDSGVVLSPISAVFEKVVNIRGISGRMGESCVHVIPACW